MFSFLNKQKEKGQAMIIAIIFFICVSVATILGLTNPVVRHIAMATSVVISKESFYAAEAGVEDVIYRLKSGLPTAPSQTLAVGNHSVVTTVADELGNKVVTSSGEANNYFRKVEATLALGSGASFFYGIQSDVGGIIIENSASVEGNAYSNGTITSSVNGRIRGDVISAGPAGLLNSVRTTGVAHAHTIQNSYVEKDAYYNTITGSTVLGLSYPGSSDQPTSTLPISDEMIEEWKSDAALGGTITSPCPYMITSSIAIGPTKIDCDLEIDGTNFTITLTGAIWVNGNISVKNSPTIQVSPSLQNRSVPIIAHDPANMTSSGKITLENSATFLGAGDNSYVLMVSQNSSAESGGSEVAIDLKNSVTGKLLVYAGHGEIVLQNSANLKEVSGFRLRLKNYATVVYETGLASLLFSSGPSGGFDIFSWREVE
ncbi:MAG: hypothetical protein V1896_02680 [Candidatus Zambryskibacteria bacterium]